ncbi:MAG: phosphatase PAP2 family protein [bacterium]
MLAKESGAGHPAAAAHAARKERITKSRALRRSEWLLVAYFSYTTALAAWLPLRASIPAVTVAMNLIVFAGLWILPRAEALRGRRFFSVMRDWYPLAMILLAYREMGWFAPATHTYELENAWISWDRLVLNDWGVRAAIESFGPFIPSVLEIAYSLVYAVPVFGMAMLYVYKRPERADRFSVTFLVGTLAAYSLFPYFPSEPPRTVFAGTDLPSYLTIFRQFNLWLVGGYGIHTSVFPSAHVAGAFCGAFGMMRLLPEHRWVGRLLLVLAVLIATATVYGRYHFVVDALAGFGLAAAAELAGRALDRSAAIS